MGLSLGEIHGIFMMLGWGFFLPLGVLLARLLKHRPNNIWFQAHRICQVLGLLFATIGFAIAVKNFHTFDLPKGSLRYSHGCLGVFVMTLGFLQPLNAVIRPSHDPASKNRVIWEYLHKGTGYLGVTLAAVTIILGTLIKGRPFQLGYWIGVVGCLVLFFVILLIDLSKHSKNQQEQPSATAVTPGTYV